MLSAIGGWTDDPTVSATVLDKLMPLLNQSSEEYKKLWLQAVQSQPAMQFLGTVNALIDRSSSSHDPG